MGKSDWMLVFAALGGAYLFLKGRGNGTQLPISQAESHKVIKDAQDRITKDLLSGDVTDAIDTYGAVIKRMGQLSAGSSIGIAVPQSEQEHLETAIYGTTLSNISANMTATEQQKVYGYIVAPPAYAVYDYYAVFPDGSKSFIGTGTSSSYKGPSITDISHGGMATSYQAVKE